LPQPLLILAPLHGITNYTYRNAYLDYFSGFDELMAPFIVTKPDLKALETHFKDLLPINNSRKRPIPQFLGNEPGEFLSAAGIVRDFGYEELNWNLGCPFAMVAKKFRGSGLLPFPDRIDQFLAAVCAKIDIKLSIKLRLGRNDAEELEALIPLLNSYPLHRIIIHPRLGVQMYRGSADVPAFDRAARQLDHEVVYNGDITDPAAYRRVAGALPGIGQVMIGRGAIANPFLPGQIKGIEKPGEPQAVIKAFHDRLYADYQALLSGPAHVMDKMKEVWSYLSRSFSHGAEGFKGIAQAKTKAEYERGVRRLFERERWLAL